MATLIDQRRWSVVRHIIERVELGHSVFDFTEGNRSRELALILSSLSNQEDIELEIQEIKEAIRTFNINRDLDRAVLEFFFKYLYVEAGIRVSESLTEDEKMWLMKIRGVTSQRLMFFAELAEQRLRMCHKKPRTVKELEDLWALLSGDIHPLMMNLMKPFDLFPPTLAVEIVPSSVWVDFYAAREDMLDGQRLHIGSIRRCVFEVPDIMVRGREQCDGTE